MLCWWSSLIIRVNIWGLHNKCNMKNWARFASIIRIKWLHKRGCSTGVRRRLITIYYLKEAKGRRNIWNQTSQEIRYLESRRWSWPVFPWALLKTFISPSKRTKLRIVPGKVLMTSHPNLSRCLPRIKVLQPSRRRRSLTLKRRTSRIKKKRRVKMKTTLSREQELSMVEMHLNLCSQWAVDKMLLSLLRLLCMEGP